MGWVRGGGVCSRGGWAAGGELTTIKSQTTTLCAQ